ncbi:ribulose bisphosphate carboxylase small subunit [Thauera sp. CAU 1555]|uniref:Ribulose bisphosphate carboxylase small subunit n=1 Tax=Thauera sedimentorum TaxID=2767595 RepID=A0ABR9BFS6_9RHOO|nr:ribulose bisphosphate carboxylase small subunit [Thauera sedimentorum]MBC9073895.1 ribulose bisphosphate carboxylase small subunit [Thauera sedimentorum]MBD8504814.1 ribulose bisphosphate carboxylase small subunit [Thauera sedimentorum]
MSEVQDYPSRLGDAASRRFETFSYLPAMSEEALRRQVAYIVERGWNPAVEHCEPENAMKHYWYMWKLPLFGETDVDRILHECRCCRDANPGHLVKLIGYDNQRQTQGTAMLIFRPEGGAGQ